MGRSSRRRYWASTWGQSPKSVDCGMKRRGKSLCMSVSSCVSAEAAGGTEYGSGSVHRGDAEHAGGEKVSEGRAGGAWNAPDGVVVGGGIWAGPPGGGLKDSENGGGS